METNDNNDLKKSMVFGKWIPKRVVQDFFNYGNTKMSTFAVDHNVRTSKVGKRIFYSYDDILNILESNTL